MNKKIPDLIREHIKKEYANGIGITELARTFNVSRTAIYDIIKGKRKEPKQEVAYSQETALISELTGMPLKISAKMHNNCHELDTLQPTNITPARVLETGINIAKSIDTNTILHEKGYALIPYPLPAIMELNTGFTHHLSWVDVYVLLLRPRAWMQYMIDSKKPFSEWGLFRGTD